MRTTSFGPPTAHCVCPETDRNIRSFFIFAEFRDILFTACCAALCRCEFIRTKNESSANEFAPTPVSYFFWVAHPMRYLTSSTLISTVRCSCVREAPRVERVELSSSFCCPRPPTSSHSPRRPDRVLEACWTRMTG